MNKPKSKVKSKIHKGLPKGQLVELSTVVQELSVACQMGVNLRDRRIFLVGEVDEELFKGFITGFSVLDAFDAPIFITFHTNGGSMELGAAIYDTIKTSKNHVTIDVVGEANSIGALVLQAADTRRMMPNARIMIHQGALFISGENRFKADEMAEHADDLKANNDRYYEILSQGSKGKMTIKDVANACKKDSYYDPKQAIDLGLVDEIIKPSL